MTRAIVAGLSVGTIYGLLALGITVVYKTTRVLNFALGEMGTFAVFVAWTFIVRWHQPWAVGALVGIVSVAAIGILFERLVVWPNIDGPRLSLLIATVGLGLLLYGAELVLWGASPQILRPPVSGCGWEIVGFCFNPLRLFALGMNVVLGLGLVLLLRYTTFGLGVLASAQDPTTVRLMGVRLSRISMFAWGTSAALAALSGLILLPAIGTFTPFSLTLFFPRALAAALLGGLTSLPGAFIGGLGVGAFEAILQEFFPAASGVVEAGLFGLVLMILLVRPRGLLGTAA